MVISIKYLCFLSWVFGALPLSMLHCGPALISQQLTLTFIPGVGFWYCPHFTHDEQELERYQRGGYNGEVLANVSMVILSQAARTGQSSTSYAAAELVFLLIAIANIMRSVLVARHNAIPFAWITQLHLHIITMIIPAQSRRDKVFRETKSTQLRRGFHVCVFVCSFF